MNPRKTLSLQELLIELRNQLIRARENKEYENLLWNLGYVFGLIEDLATDKGDGPTALLAMEMYEAVRDSAMGEKWKSNIPTIEEIEEVFNDGGGK